MKRSDWWFFGAASLIIGGVLIAADIWTTGTAAYESVGRRGESFERMIIGLASIFGDKGAAIVVGLTGVGAGVGLGWAALKARRS